MPNERPDTALQRELDIGSVMQHLTPSGVVREGKKHCSIPFEELVAVLEVYRKLQKLSNEQAGKIKDLERIIVTLSDNNARKDAKLQAIRTLLD